MREIDGRPTASEQWRRPLAQNALALLMLVAASVSAVAQTLPPSVAPGLVPRQLSRPETQPQVRPQISIPETPMNKPPLGTEKVKLEVKKIIVDGSTVYSPQQLKQITAPYVGHPIVVAALFKLANKITEKYRADGYIISQAVVPAQTLNRHQSVVHIRVIEGYVSSYRVQGYKSARIVAYLRHIMASKPLRAKVLERYMLLANDLPGVTATAALSPSENMVGGSVLTLVARHKLVDVSISGDNRGTRYIGPGQFYVESSINIPGSGQLSAQYITTPPNANELQYSGVSYQQPIGSDGLRATIFGDYFVTHPEYGLELFNTRSIGSTVGVSLLYPIIRSRVTNLEVHGTFDVDDFVTHLLRPPYQPPSSNDHLRVLRFGLHYDLADQYDGTNVLTGEASQGLPAFGASATGSKRELPSRPGEISDFTKLHVQFLRFQDLSWIHPGVSAVAGAEAQIANGPLPASEQFTLGGPAYGRAYDPADIVGDDGIAGKLELRYTGVPSPKMRDLLNSYQLYAFSDIGRAFNNIASIGSAQLASAGFGVRLALKKHLSADLEVAKGLGRNESVLYNRTPSVGRPWRFFFSTKMSF